MHDNIFKTITVFMLYFYIIPDNNHHNNTSTNRPFSQADDVFTYKIYFFLVIF